MSQFNIVHCSYHKCLTTYYIRVMQSLFERRWFRRRRYLHFNSRLNDFYERLGRYRIASVNNHFVEFDRLGDFRLSRFVRDPRDLIVSGYYYHLRGAEKWSQIVAPNPSDWFEVNGVIPKDMPKDGVSYAEYLQSLSLEDGLMAEIEFRQRHFHSMRQWPLTHPRIRTYRYEDFLGNEEEVFAELFEFYEFSSGERRRGMRFVRQFALRNRQEADAHIRNPQPGQWEESFTPKVSRCFNARYGDLLRQLGYAET